MKRNVTMAIAAITLLVLAWLSGRLYEQREVQRRRAEALIDYRR